MAEESKASAGVPDATVFGEATACVYELVAFPNRGSAEAVRLLFALTNTPFRDQTITQKKAAKYKKTLKLGRLPVLFDDSTCTEIGSIRAMLQHIARKKSALNAAHVLWGLLCSRIVCFVPFPDFVLCVGGMGTLQRPREARTVNGPPWTPCSK